MKAQDTHRIGERGDDPPLTKRQIESLKKAHADSIDPVRYVIVSPITRKHCLYYFPSDSCFAMNHITPECLFKRKAEARAVAKVVSGRRKKTKKHDLQIIAVKKTKKGVKILDEVFDPWEPNKTWKPKLTKK
jgi:hypothetical protein